MKVKEKIIALGIVLIAVACGNSGEQKVEKTAVHLEKTIEVLPAQEKSEKGIKAGQPAPLFAMNDSEGNSIALESFRGKYVLVDFWASWCGPCRAENPNVVEAYQKYHDMGLEILGVSLDDKEEKWLKAIKRDGLAWTHVSDLKGWGNAAAQLYGVNAIPFSVLLDKEGNVVAKNLRGEALQNKLAAIFGAE